MATVYIYHRAEREEELNYATRHNNGPLQPVTVDPFAKAEGVIVRSDKKKEKYNLNGIFAFTLITSLNQSQPIYIPSYRRFKFWQILREKKYPLRVSLIPFVISRSNSTEASRKHDSNLFTATNRINRKFPSPVSLAKLETSPTRVPRNFFSFSTRFARTGSIWGRKEKKKERKTDRRQGGGGGEREGRRVIILSFPACNSRRCSRRSRWPLPGGPCALDKASRGCNWQPERQLAFWYIRCREPRKAAEARHRGRRGWVCDCCRRSKTRFALRHGFSSRNWNAVIFVSPFLLWGRCFAGDLIWEIGDDRGSLDWVSSSRGLSEAW